MIKIMSGVLVLFATTFVTAGAARAQAVVCERSDLGGIDVDLYDAGSRPDYISSKLVLKARPAKKGCCTYHRWIQVGQITPPLNLPAASSLAKKALLARAWVDGDHPGLGVPYYTDTTPPGVPATVASVFDDNPILRRSNAQPGAPVTFKLVVALMCSKAGTDRFVEFLGWGFSFEDNQENDMHWRDEPSNASLPEFWKKGVKADYPKYKWSEK